MARSEWRDIARRVIERTLESLPPETTRRGKLEAIKRAFPFGERRNWPYKVWLQEQAAAIDPARGRPRLVFVRPVFLAGSWQGIVCCEWCQGQGGCIACCVLRARLHELTPTMPWHSWVKLLLAFKRRPDCPWTQEDLARHLDSWLMSETADVVRRYPQVILGFGRRKGREGEGGDYESC